MSARSAAILFCAMTSAKASAQTQLLRFDDDFAAQRAQCEADGQDRCIKAVTIDDTFALKLSLGGEARWRYEYMHNPAYGEEPQDPRGAFLQRYAGFVDMQAGGHLRGFLQLNSALASGRAAGPSPVDENRLDFENAFVEFSSDGGPREATVGLRQGIQEMRLGSGRLVDVREGPNVRRTFQGTRAYGRFGLWHVDAFRLSSRQARPGAFDDTRSQTQDLRGAYATCRESNAGLEMYLFHIDDRLANYVQGRAQEERWSVGARTFGQRGRWDWNWEGVYQGGSFGDASIHAWTLATDTGYAFPDAWGAPRFALLAAVASGDRDAHDLRLGTFNPMYPRGNYFGEEATLGPRNFYNLQPTLSFEPIADLTINTSMDIYWRKELGWRIRTIRRPGAGTQWKPRTARRDDRLGRSGMDAVTTLACQLGAGQA